MNPQEWRDVKSVLTRAMALPPTQRDGLLDAECVDRPELRQEIESLLAAHDVGAEDHTSVLADARLDDARPMHVGGHVAPPAQDMLRAAIESGLAAQFDILGALGHGGMGSVYLAHERALGRTVAIKVLHPDRASTPGSRERFRREARIAAGLSHTGIVPLHAFGEVNGLWYFVMEHVRGASLAQRLELEGRLPPDEARRILIAVSEALVHAHRHGVVHRDIKPANILLDEEAGRPRLADFGISKIEGSSDAITAAGAIVGTPLYMSPEQAAGDVEVDARSDIFSLGAVAYVMLSGRAPFTGRDAHDVLARRLVADVVPLQEVAPRVPAELARVVMRCLARERDDRWRDTSALLTALRGSANVRSVDLPQAIADLPGFAAYAIGWLTLWITIATRSVNPESRYLLLLIAAIVPVGLSLHVWRLRAYGMSMRKLVRMALRPPHWWGMWWPVRLRHPDDIWSRLPRSARVARIALSTFLVLIPFVTLVSDGNDSALHAVRNRTAIALVAGTLATLLVALYATMRGGLNFDAAMQFLVASTAPSAFWQEPAVVRQLRSAVPLVRPPDANLPSDHARAVEELIAHFPTSLLSVRQLVTRAVQQQVAAIAMVDRELALLARDASHEEAERLSARLLQLAAHEGASNEHGELLDTVRRQLDVVRRMQGRRALVLADRAARCGLLGALWSQLTARVESERDGPGAVAEAELRIRTLCERMSPSAQSSVT